MSPHIHALKEAAQRAKDVLSTATSNVLAGRPVILDKKEKEAIVQFEHEARPDLVLYLIARLEQAEKESLRYSNDLRKVYDDYVTMFGATGTRIPSFEDFKAECDKKNDAEIAGAIHA